MRVPYPLPALQKALSAPVVSCLLVTQTPVLIKSYPASSLSAIILVSRIQSRFSGSSQASPTKTASLFSPLVGSHRFLTNAPRVSYSSRCSPCNSSVVSRAFRRAVRSCYLSFKHCCRLQHLARPGVRHRNRSRRPSWQLRRVSGSIAFACLGLCMSIVALAYPGTSNKTNGQKLGPATRWPRADV